MNGQACLDMEVEVRESRKEFRESEVEFSHITAAALPFSGQPLDSTMLEKSLISFLISWILSPPLDCSSVAHPHLEAGHSLAQWLPEPQTSTD